ncbi:MAG: FecR domain-containing protein, partial [Candidatus Omnitrophica bacterium]|nr:FecR domain-containing protein [Candidatus Omnitrophota bacterium]
MKLKLIPYNLILKNTTIIAIVVASGLFLAATVHGQEADASTSTVPSGQVLISTMAGDVQIMHKGTETWEPAASGATLIEGDTVKTFDDGRVEIEFSTGSSITLKENTTFVIIQVTQSEENPDESTIKTDLAMGRIKAVIERMGHKSSFEVRTPTAVASVRGTVYFMNVLPETGGMLADDSQGAGAVEDLFTEIFVDDGTVDFTNTITDDSYPVDEDEGSASYDDGRVLEPTVVPEDKQSEFKAGFDLPAQKKEEKKEEKKDKKKKEAKKDPAKQTPKK